MRCHMIHGAFFSILAVLGAACVAQAQAPEKEKLLGVVYDVSGLLDKPQFGREKNRLTDVIDLIMGTIRPQVWRAKDSPHSIFGLHGKKLEIHTTQENHEEIVGLLAALERLRDHFVVVETGLYEVERGVYEKEI